MSFHVLLLSSEMGAGWRLIADMITRLDSSVSSISTFFVFCYNIEFYFRLEIHWFWLLCVDVRVNVRWLGNRSV
jgi:hypothetical protein